MHKQTVYTQCTNIKICKMQNVIQKIEKHICTNTMENVAQRIKKTLAPQCINKKKNVKCKLES